MRQAFGALAVLLVLSLLTAPACGKKAPPRVPKKSFEPAVLDLRGGWADGYVELSGRISHPELLEEITGCRVFYAEFPPGQTPCDTCPIEFKGYQGFGPEVIVDGGFLCKVPGKERGLVSFFQVRLAGPEGILGPPSRTVRVDVK
jgi:hypothetical protein